MRPGVELTDSGIELVFTQFPEKIRRTVAVIRNLYIFKNIL